MTDYHYHQEQLDQECIDMLPLIKQEIIKAETKLIFNREIIENMRNLALIEATNSHKPLVDMTKQELLDFQHCLLKMFKYHGLTK